MERMEKETRRCALPSFCLFLIPWNYNTQSPHSLSVGREFSEHNFQIYYEEIGSFAALQTHGHPTDFGRTVPSTHSTCQVYYVTALVILQPAESLSGCCSPIPLEGILIRKGCFGLHIDSLTHNKPKVRIWFP